MSSLTGRGLVAGVAIAVIVAAIAGGLLLLGSPGEERARALDRRRVEDLTNLARAVDLYWTRHTRLPSSSEELVREPGSPLVLRDPATSERYGYRPLGGDAYEVCARFERRSQTDGRVAADAFWSHDPGWQCFRRQVQKVG